MGAKTAVLMALVVAVVVPGSPVLGQEWTPDKDQVVEQPEPYSPYVDQHFPQQVFFGDTHHHSSFSVDSGMFGNTLGPEESFRFARGEEVISTTGLRAKLIRPLDFLVVSDHAEYLGLSDLLAKGDPQLLATEAGKEWYAALQEGGDAAWLTAVAMMDDFNNGNERVKDPKLKRSVWDRVVDIASEYDDPGALRLSLRSLTRSFPALKSSIIATAINHAASPPSCSAAYHSLPASVARSCGSPLASRSDRPKYSA